MPSTLPVQTGIVADYTFDEGSGSTLHDRSGTSPDASFGSTAPSWVANGLKFSGQASIPLGISNSTYKTVYAVVTFGLPANDNFASLITSDQNPRAFDSLWFLHNQSVNGVTDPNFLGYYCPTLGLSGVRLEGYCLPGVASVRAWSIGTGGDYIYSGSNAQQGLQVGTNGSMLAEAGPRGGNMILGWTSTWNVGGGGIVVSRLAVFTETHSPDQIAQNFAQIAADCQARGFAVDTPNAETANVMVVDGDSISARSNASDNAHAWQNVAEPLIPDAYRRFGFAVPGQTAQQILDRFEARRIAGLFGNAPKKLYILWGTTNSIAGGDTADNTFAAVQGTIAKVQAAVPGVHVLLLPMLSRAGADAGKNAINAKLATLASSRVTFITPDQLPDLTPDGAFANATYFDQNDQTHPKDPGHLEIGQAVGATVPAINYVVTPPPPTITGVSVSPASATVQGGSTQQFSATVQGTGNFDQTVAWSASAGSISSAGLFTAPAATSAAQAVTITAKANGDTAKQATASVTVPAQVVTPPTISGVTISPSSATVQGGGTQAFTATVQGTGSYNPAVAWSSVPSGLVSSAGLLTAPVAASQAQAISVRATAVGDTSRYAIAAVTVPAATVTPPPVGSLTLTDADYDEIAARVWAYQSRTLTSGGSQPMQAGFASTGQRHGPDPAASLARRR